ncbi:MAG: hypothetical protein E7L00_08455 [Propionibacteriaceae bacterium]|nr:hypothetical protein [Propionibacteriaceae bacterium]
MVRTARQAVTQALADALNIPVHTAIPERAIAPFVHVGESPQFIAPDDNAGFGAWLASFDCVIVVEQSASNQQMVDDADAYATKLIDTNDSTRLGIEIRGYETTQLNSATYLVVPFTVTAPIER